MSVVYNFGAPRLFRDLLSSQSDRQKSQNPMIQNLHAIHQYRSKPREFRFTAEGFGGELAGCDTGISMGRLFLPSLVFQAFTLFSWSFQEGAAAVDDSIRDVLASIRSWQLEHEASQEQSSSLRRPFVTLSFAQSINGRIALGNAENEAGPAHSSNYPFSGTESLRMTHAIRSIHTGILIGGGTLESDNPQLNNRFWDGDGEESYLNQPRPIILDTHLSHTMLVGDKIRLDRPIVCCSREAASSLETLPTDVNILPCNCGADGKLDLEDVLFQLWSRQGIKLVMVEGGASVLSSFLQQNLFDTICITVAPKLVGEGLEPLYKGAPLDLSQAGRFILLGADAVLLYHHST